MTIIKSFFLLYIVVIAIIYALAKHSGPPFLLPGDIYISKGLNRVYIPIGFSLIVTIIAYTIIWAIAR